MTKSLFLLFLFISTQAIFAQEWMSSFKSLYAENEIKYVLQETNIDKEDKDSTYYSIWVINDESPEWDDIEPFKRSLFEHPLYLNKVDDFKDGKKGLHKTLKSLTSSHSAKAADYDKGIAVVQLSFNASGELTEKRVIKSISKKTDKRILKALKKFPTWKGTKENGKAVSFITIVPISF